jgi:NAD-dependent dihydropyrimidine dehydrogenase PreA subunit
MTTAVPYIIGEPCIDVMDRSCMEECPVDCIYEGSRKLYINPQECIDCGACESLCPVEAIRHDRSVTAAETPFAIDNARFFDEPLHGRSEPLGLPGGAAGTGPIGVDTDFVATYVASA